MQLDLKDILITGRTYDEYMAFFDLDYSYLKTKKVLDCPSGASSFVATANSKEIYSKGVDIIYKYSPDKLYIQGKKSIDKIYEDATWMQGHSFEFYKSINNHKKHRIEALENFIQHYKKEDYSYMELPKLDFSDDSFDLILSSHLLFVYDDRFSYEFHKQSILEMLRIAKEVRLFPLVDYQNKRVDKEKNFSPYVYQIIDELQEYKCEIVKVNFEFQSRADYMLKIIKE